MSCGKPLRAPSALAGKKGKCARCGTVNRVPVVVSVDVKRSAAPSPFRSTADLPVRAAIEGAIELATGRFHATTAIAKAVSTVPEGGPDFFDQVASRMDGLAEACEAEQGEEVDDSPPPRPTGRRRPLHVPLEADTLPLDAHYDPHPAHRAQDLTRVVAAALVVGAVAGFGIGLLASKWLM